MLRSVPQTLPDSASGGSCRQFSVVNLGHGLGLAMTTNKQRNDQQSDGDSASESARQLNSLLAECVDCPLIDQIEDALFVVTTAGEVVYANQAAHRLVNAPGEIAGQRLPRRLASQRQRA
jgi:PAS domain-containing protein